MFELTIALRYLIPRKKSLSTALVSLLSVFVISLVVWLVLIFLSVTTGIERNWLQKLTSLYSPVRIAPTERYYSSYYYQVDSLSAASEYTPKTIGEKAISPLSDPYSEQEDRELPRYWSSPDRSPDGHLRDPVKETLSILNKTNLSFQDYEISGALLRLSLNRPTSAAGPGATLSQMSYLLSFMDRNPNLSTLLVPPSLEDLESLLKGSSSNPEQFRAILANCSIEEVHASILDSNLLPDNVEFLAFSFASTNGDVIIPLASSTSLPKGSTAGKLVKNGTNWFWRSNSGVVVQKPPLHLQEPLPLSATIGPFEKATFENFLQVKGSLQGVPISGRISLNGVVLSKGNLLTTFDYEPAFLPPWIISVNTKCQLPANLSMKPFLLPKSYRDMGVRIGDHGTLSFAANGAASMQEHRISVQVAGFYDPGLFSMGGRCLIVPQEITRTIHAASQTFSPDGTPTNGISVWCKSNEAQSVKQTIEKQLTAPGLGKYWKISTYQDYEFSKELFQQFRSDRTLFIMIAILILLVACCNIISLLVLLVNDKKREIAILQSMGASWQSVALIFGICGLSMGALSSLIGTVAALFTLNHLDSVVSFLSSLQGHAAFQPAFFGQSLPNQLSTEALIFVMIATPLLSLFAGLVPALRACRIRPSIALRQE